jgi:hypothetical protein
VTERRDDRRKEHEIGRERKESYKKERKYADLIFMDPCIAV